MAVAQSKAQKPASKACSNANSNAAKAKMQMHRRSRTGCYTCRLRRKKCDEGSPSCTACKHLGLRCEYKRPMWWSNNDQRLLQKNNIKTIIKRKKLSEKTNTSSSSLVMTPGAESPPGLCHSLPTSTTFSDSLDRTRSASIDSQLSLFDFHPPPTIVEYPTYSSQMPPHSQYAPVYPEEWQPYEIDVKTERQMFVNDVPTRRESTISTFSSYYAPASAESVAPPFQAEHAWEEVYDERRESLTEESMNVPFFDFAHAPAPRPQVAVDLDDTDQALLDHFISDVLPSVFPVLEAGQQGWAWNDYVLPALQSNKYYLHCCLSFAAQHYGATRNAQGGQIDEKMRYHLHATISELCAALKRDADHSSMLEATLGMIIFQCSVGRSGDAVPEIPWHQHFQPASELVQRLELNSLIAQQHDFKSFNMTLTAWIDILGSTIQGRAPKFADAYREKHLSPINTSLGLRELMGCEDRVMYLISEIACLEALKRDGMDDMELCQHVHSLGDEIGLTEIGETGPKIPFHSNGVLNPKQLSKNMTAAFRLAARIYLCSLVPGFSPSQASCVGLVEKLTRVLEFIPAGQYGFDRSLVWVYLIGGSVSTASSSFRSFFNERMIELGDLSDLGNFGRVATVLKEVWSHVDGRHSPGGGEAHYVSWRDVMITKGWDFLLI
ncbi:hypothetical protein OIDMADRAFT_115392 [Oidiodendron maius Zn]|uniref:Zn(2)-C6 fungal-type domain-containing protein n=1 Tax=Oidiodendron maius (strain Zn) TaxID=913774 RepID=A0A0C3D0L0_OIDMZ|nr:hypothetical protein OIDMADRAFT_115392 [Oidiodendron maius Zn]